MQRRTQHTIETIRERLIAMRDVDPVYKVDVDLLWDNFRTAFEADWKTVKDTKYLSIDHDDRTEADGELYFAAPYEVRHRYGKKFSDFLINHSSSDFTDATISHRNRWRPLFNEVQELRARQIKGRKPAPKKEVISTRTQLRAICPCCFKQHAVKNDRLVAHGYTLDYGFQNGNCAGVGQKHFGTEDGKAFAMQLSADAMARARDIEARAQRFDKGEEHVTIRKRDYRGIWMTISNPTPLEKAEHIRSMHREADGYRRYAGQLNLAIMDWKPADAVEVEVEVTA